MPVKIFQDKLQLGAAAASDVAELLRGYIARNGRARIIAATGNSQLDFIKSLTGQPGIEWSAVEIFHLDEYAGLPANHPASFRRWIRTRLAEKVRPAATHYLEGDAADLAAEMRRYTALLTQAPVDLCFLGVGENGHLAFNDPGVADFSDPLIVKRVVLDTACRNQQVGEGHFPTLDDVPPEAVTLTCSALMRVERWICCVPEHRKAEAVRNALEGPLSTSCPASLIRRHGNATVYLDHESAALLSS